MELENLKKLIGYDLFDEQYVQMENFCKLLLDWNGRINLTAIREEAAIYRKHFSDSLIAHSVLPALGVKRVLDVGAGAGFPGLPLVIANPGLNLVIVETVGKKCRFMEEVVCQLGMQNVSVVNGRIEEDSVVSRIKKVDAVIGRAVFYLPILLEVAAPYLDVGGYVIAYKSLSRLEEELRDCAHVLGLCNFNLENKIVYEIDGDQRVLLVFKKNKKGSAYSRPIHQLKKLYKR